MYTKEKQIKNKENKINRKHTEQEREREDRERREIRVDIVSRKLSRHAVSFPFLHPSLVCF